MHHGRYRFGVLGMSLVALLVPVYATVAETPVPADPAQILKQVQAKYDAMKSYSDSGQVITEIDMSGRGLHRRMKMNPELQKKNQADQKFKNSTIRTSTFSIKMARPNLYLIEWQEYIHPTFTDTGAVWSAGEGDFVTFPGNRVPHKMFDREAALAMAIGLSNGAAHAIPSVFFGTHSSIFNVFANPVFEKEETLDGDECYVISGGPANQNSLLWISKKSLLIRQRRQILGGVPFTVPRNSDEEINKAQKNRGQAPTTQGVKGMKESRANAGRMTTSVRGYITETHKNIMVDVPLTKDQLTPKKLTPTTELKNKPGQPRIKKYHKPQKPNDVIRT
jgi:hypothetical protein